MLTRVALGLVLLAFLATLLVPNWRLERNASAVIAGDADAVFRFATDIDEWPSWRPDVVAVRHLEGEGFDAEIHGVGRAEIYRFDVDFPARVMTWEAPKEQWRMGVTQAEGGARVEVSVSYVRLTFVDWVWMQAANAGATAGEILDALAVSCVGGACATTTLE